MGDEEAEDLLFTIRQELGFSRIEWDNLDWMSQRVYIRGMSRYIWRKQYAEWESKPAGKRGPAPIKPTFNEDISEETKTSSTEYPDIDGMEGMDISYI